MSDNQLSETQPVTPEPVKPENELSEQPYAPKSKLTWWIVGGIVTVLIVGAIGAFAGYYSGIANRQATEKNNKALAASMQYQLGVTDLKNSRYEFAKKRFEYVIQLDPGFPGVLEKMAEISIIMNATATPTPAPIATVAPTLDLSGVESLLAQAKQFLAAKDWNSATAALDAMRKQNASFKTLEVDGLYYLALRNRGIQKINQLGELESGIYDIVLMSRFGPIDKEARDADEWGSYYIYGARFWGVDWLKVIKDLQIVYANNPYMLDQAHITAKDRYRIALAKEGDQLFAKGNFCDAASYYLQSLQVADDGKIGESYTKANNKCLASLPTETPSVTPGGEVTPITEPTIAPTEVTPPVVPTEVPTAVPTEVPTITPTP
jgi:hypothetical protein